MEKEETDIVHSIYGTPNSTGMLDLLDDSIVHLTRRMNNDVYLNKMMDQTEFDVTTGSEIDVPFQSKGVHIKAPL